MTGLRYISLMHLPSHCQPGVLALAERRLGSWQAMCV